jgi:drug/metabolite transporter (DMT)-like permease
MVQTKGGIMFYISAGVAIVGAVSYQYFVHRIPDTLNPIVSVLGMYLAVLVLGLVLLPIFSPEGGLIPQIRQLGWLQLALAISVIMIELGFLLMYRFGWNLSTGNLITGVVVNSILLGIGVVLLGEKVTPINALGVGLCILGVALISHR